MNIPPENQVAFLSYRARTLIKNILLKAGYDAAISDEILSSSTSFFLRDIYRLEEQQFEQISLAKFAGYWGFWIRKLKPISGAVRVGAEEKQTEVQEINEIVSILFAIEIMKILREKAVFHDAVWSACQTHANTKCSGTKCLDDHAHVFFNFNKRFFLNYIHYSMRHRTFGPHHFALLMEQLLFSSCARIQFDSTARKALIGDE